MSNAVTLDSIRAAAEAKYAPLVIQLDNSEEVTLRNVMRLSEKERESVTDLLSQLSASDEHDDSDDGDSEGPSEAELVELVHQIIVIVAKDKKGTKLIRALSGDITLLMEVINMWTDRTAPGEA